MNSAVGEGGEERLPAGGLYGFLARVDRDGDLTGGHEPVFGKQKHDHEHEHNH